MIGRPVAWLGRAVSGDWNGLHLAVNVFIATTLLWLLLRTWADLNPIWAISSMVAASDPVVKQAAKTFRGRIVNSLVGSAVGMLVLVVGGPSDWKLPLAMAAAIIVSSYVVRQPTMFRQAPITAAIVIAAGLEKHSKLSGVELGVRRVGEVLLGCVVGVLVSWAMAKLWPAPQASKPGG
ncbi:MAG: FUSC family protein [Burkholderiales bacterium]|nr:FUSC family protein [Burkholderiales bacterium]